MNGMFRNSKVLRDLAKHSQITDCCKDYNLDFLLFLILVSVITLKVFLTGYPVE
jgi:hypothetical protein